MCLKMRMMAKEEEEEDEGRTKRGILTRFFTRKEPAEKRRYSY